MGKLFGTDGVRGIANKDLTPKITYRLGEAAGLILANKSISKIIVGRDTRKSGDLLSTSLISGILSTGTNVVDCGVIPTPAIALLTKHLGAGAGIVISASHNPPEYNGIKMFNNEGLKLTTSQEKSIEDYVLGVHSRNDSPTGKDIGTITNLSEATEIYIQHAIDSVGADLSDLTVAIDCAYGAAFRSSPEAFTRLGATIYPINTNYDGMNINVNCGSTDLTPLKKLVLKTKADFGVAFDGDADRVLAVDELGNEIDGDTIIAICAKALKETNRLNNNLVVSTVMANLGFDKAMESLGIDVLKTDVGDKYVLAEMIEAKASLGGEQSGHVIFLDHNSTGDGLITALKLAAIIKDSGSTLSELAKIITKYPQVLINVKVLNKQALDNNKAIDSSIKQVENELANDGRVLVRASGTEPLVRVMVEAKHLETARKSAETIANIVDKELN